VTLLILGFGFTAIKKSTMDTNQLNGTWVPVKQEMGGKSLPKEALQQKLIIDGKNYTVIAESTDKGEIAYRGNKMDIYGKEGVNAGKHFTAIYKYENGQLIICYNLAGNSYPEAFETQGKPLFFLSVFEKETKK
jgi:uncharacterized protein (TIGR03067 family)